jgi:hypothetical protein
MPELLCLIACERVIVDEQKNPSLIVLMERVEAQIPEGQQLPADVITPREWAVFTVWKKKDGEEPGHSRLFTEVVPPAGVVRSMKTEVEFDFTDRTHKVIQKFVGIPVGTSGTCWINVRLECATGATETFSYPIEILHKSVPVVSRQQGAVR